MSPPLQSSRPAPRVDLAAAARLLREGGLVAFPTETFYGLGALFHRADALDRLLSAKLRPAGKPLPLLAADRAQVAELSAGLSGAASRLADRFWPGPLTLVLPAAAGLPAVLGGGTGTVGVRVSGSPLARALAAAAGGAIVATSANLAGRPPPAAAGEIEAGLLGHLDGVLDGGPTPGGLPSTVVEMVGSAPRLLRAGAIPWDAIEAALR